MPREEEDEKKILKEVIDKPMGDDDIKNYLKNPKIIIYNQLPKYNNINEILPAARSYAVILYQNSPNSGHWCTIMRPTDNTIEFFDSYGKECDHCLSWLSAEDNKKLGINDKYLLNLIKKSGYELIHNKTCFQGSNGGVSTCGRHCCFRIQNLKKKNMSLEDYTHMMKTTKNKTNMNFDKLVSVMVSPEAD